MPFCGIASVSTCAVWVSSCCTGFMPTPCHPKNNMCFKLEGLGLREPVQSQDLESRRASDIGSMPDYHASLATDHA